MAQVKKNEIKRRILLAAGKLFAKRGYARATVGEIAKEARVSPSNVYVYFESKLKIMFAIYEPWFKACVERLDQEIVDLPTAEAKLFRIVERLWRDIAADANGFSNSIIQAISSATPEDRYDPTLLLWTEQKIANLLRGALPPERARELDCVCFAHVLMMAFDGFAVNGRSSGTIVCDDKIITQMCSVMMGKSVTLAARSKSSTRGRVGQRQRVR